MEITPTDCSKFKFCNAMVCPLDNSWNLRHHMSGERICGYLREYYKEQGSVDNIPEYLCKELENRAESIMGHFGLVRTQVCNGAITPSKISQFKEKLKVQNLGLRS